MIASFRRRQFRSFDTLRMKTIQLTDTQAARVRDLVNDKQDALFDKLSALPDTLKHGARGDGLRGSLRFWDSIDLAVRDSDSKAADELSAVEFAIDLLEKIPAFGDSIGDEVSKAQLGVALNKLRSAIQRVEVVAS